MDYEITRLVLGPKGKKSIPITKSRFQEVCGAKRHIVVISSLEEKLDTVLENFLEYEQELIDISLHHMIHSDMDFVVVGHDRRRINRRLLNLLSACKMYLNQAVQDCCDLYSGKRRTELKAAVKRKIDETGQKVFAFRALNELRNYVQHRGLPIHAVVYPSSWDDTRERCRFGIQPALDLSEIRGRFDPAVRKELENLAAEQEKKRRKGQSEFGDTRVYLTRLVRENVEAITGIHEMIRERVTSDVEDWESILRSVLTEARVELGDPFVGIAAVAKENETVVEKEDLFDDLMELPSHLRRGNRHFGKMSARYVTGEIWNP